VPSKNCCPSAKLRTRRADLPVRLKKRRGSRVWHHRARGRRRSQRRRAEYFSAILQLTASGVSGWRWYRAHSSNPSKEDRIRRERALRANPPVRPRLGSVAVTFQQEAQRVQDGRLVISDEDSRLRGFDFMGFSSARVSTGTSSRSRLHSPRYQRCGLMFAAGLPAEPDSNRLIWNGLVKTEARGRRTHGQLREWPSRNRAGPGLKGSGNQREPSTKRPALAGSEKATGPPRSSSPGSLLPCGGTGGRSRRPPRGGRSSG
jgi:hypothetical protein